ncbi:MAG: hypothetical protein NT041_00565 [Candidatus Vogelbacteria bacterium]|nr:hypothetical protein [Candidatus Vogelbacteria bacterium]
MLFITDSFWLSSLEKNKKTLGFISRFLPGQAMIRFYVTEIYLNNKLIDDGCSPYDVMSINWNEGIAGPNRILPFDKLIDILDSK